MITARFSTTAFAIAVGGVLAVSGCTTPAPAPAPQLTSTSLPDPTPTTLALGDKVLIQRQGQGPTALDLTGLVGTAKDVTVSWACLGTGDVQVIDSKSAKVLVGSACATNSPQAIDSGKIPMSIVSSLNWELTANTTTHWRIVVYTNG